MLKYGVEALLPKDIAADDDTGYEEALAAAITPIDRDRELLIVNTAEERDTAIAVLERHGVEYEAFELLRLPGQAEATQLFPDYGFIAASGAAYAYGYLCAVFKLESAGADAGPGQAEAQMSEHVIARFGANGQRLFLTDRSLNDLIRGIAKAYRCTVEFVYGDA
ncbi:hypothetical protein [Paenibacillus ginsengarvi]|uniref:Uncharacterized protein n=1 Tax=Paenibacillus ginsengarvi TaxID=400777 RepID=A0A3B0CX55_9BACL|nr:hypothetical protein [Paenibacillus ginsengarvi]RKN86917.1 hypothetical protein D7M11_02890 [Paenibacillus ginsengarvi]